MIFTNGIQLIFTNGITNGIALAYKPDEGHETLKLIADFSVAVGTIAAVIVAIFQDKIRAWILRPKLVVEMGTPIKTPFRVEESAERKEKVFVTAYLFKLLIHNDGAQRAEEVEVFASKLFRKQADESFKLVKQFPPRNLTWPGKDDDFIKAISPKMQRECEFVAIIKPDERSKAFNFDNPDLKIPANQTILAFHMRNKPYAKTHCIGPGVYRVVLHVAAANTKPNKVTIEINHTGQWFDDEEKMFSTGVGFQMIRNSTL